MRCGPIPDGWKLFTHVQGATRMINADHAPVENLYPLHQLKPDIYIRDRVKVSFPADWPPGPVQLRMGLWRGAERAKAQGREAAADNAIELGTIAVTRP